MRRPASGYRTVPVYLSRHDDQWQYHYARQYARKVLGMDPAGAVDEPIDINPDDVFYAPDYAPGLTIEAANAGIYARWRARGVSVNFLIHDLLPVLRPEFFPPGADANHAAWLDCIAAQGDRLVCISQVVADEARSWLTTRHGNADRRFQLPGCTLAPISAPPDTTVRLRQQVARHRTRRWQRSRPAPPS